MSSRIEGAATFNGLAEGDWIGEKVATFLGIAGLKSERYMMFDYE